MSKDYIFEPRPIYSSYTPNLFLGSYYIEDGFRADPTMWADPLEDAFVTNAGMKEGKIDTGTYLDNFSAETFLMGTKKLDALEVLPQSYFWKWDNYDAHLQIPTEISEDNFEFSAYERYLECAAGYVSDNDPYFLLVIDAFMDEGQDIDLWAEEADWTRIQTTVRWWKLYDLWMEDEGVDFLTNLAHEDYDWSIRNAGELQNIGYEIPEPDDDDYYWSMRQAESFAANDPPSYRGLLLKPANHVGRSKICDAKGCRKVMKHWRRSWGIPYYFCDQHQQHIDDTYQAENEGSWMTFGRVDYNWATEPDDVELTDEEFQEIDELVRDEIRYEIDRDNIPGDSSMYWYGDWEAHGHEEFTISYYWGPAQTTGVNSAEGFGAESDQFPSMHYGDYDSDAQEKYQDFIYEWDLDDNPPSFEEWYRGNKYHEAEVCPCGCAMVGCVCSPSCKGECLGAESFSAEMGDLVKDNEWIVFGTKKTGGTTQGNQGMMLGRSPSLKGAKKMMENFRKKGYGNRYATIGKRLKRQKALLGGLLEAEGDVCWRCAEYGDKIPSHCKNCGVCEECECAVECESRETLGSETLVWKDKTLSFMDWAKQEEASHLKKYRAESFADENCRENHLMCDDCKGVCLDCHPEADAGGDICKFCSGESIERYDAESDWEDYNSIELGKENWDLHWLDDTCTCDHTCTCEPTQNIKTSDIITKKFNDEMHKTMKKVKEGANPDKEAQKLFDKMEKFMEKYEDEGATDTEPRDNLVEYIDAIFEENGYKEPEIWIAETFEAEYIHIYDTTITEPEILKKLEGAGIKPTDYYWLNEDTFGLHINSSDADAFQEEFNKKDWTGLYAFDAHWGVRFKRAETFEAVDKDGNVIMGEAYYNWSQPCDVCDGGTLRQEGDENDLWVVIWCDSCDFSQQIKMKEAESFGAESRCDHPNAYTVVGVVCPSCGTLVEEIDIDPDEEPTRVQIIEMFDSVVECDYDHEDPVWINVADADLEVLSVCDVCCIGDSYTLRAESFEAPVHKDECTVCVGFADLKDLAPDYEVFHLCDDCITKAKTMSAESFAAQSDGVKRVCQRNITQHCKNYSLGWVNCPGCGQPYTDEDVVTDDETDYKKFAESFEAPYTGAGSLMGITGDTDLSSFTSKELTESSAIHGDFDTASLDYSGHQNIEVRAEDNSLQRVWTILIDDNDAYSETFVFNSKKSAINFREAAMDSEYLAQQDIGVYNIVEQQVIDEEYPSDSYIADFLSIDCLKCGDDCGCDEIGLDAEARLSPQEALEVCEAGGAVYLKDYTDQPDDYDSFDYPIEDPEDIRMYIEEGLFDGPNAVTILSEPRPMEASVRF